MDFVEEDLLADAFRRYGPGCQRRLGSESLRPSPRMLGRPVQLPEARDLYQGGLKIASCLQFGKADTVDWLGGQAAGVQHAKRGWQLHVAAGGSYGAPIHASIDDDPAPEQYKQLVAGYLRGWEAVLGRHRVGVHANSKTVDCALQDGLGAYFWHYDWGSPEGYTHPAAHLHQVEIGARTVGGVGVDRDHVLKPRCGQWG